ncbi:MAG: hypothetical protein KDJ67_16480 [Nitratireductor sp.]|nr:hypothetical protein [Nitratireductor sp.]
MGVADEMAMQIRLLNIPLGWPGSGMIRYGAAMYLHSRGQMDDALLEAYRICCKLDGDDPIEVMQLRRQRNLRP